jgi:hypothetical protein
MTNKTTQEQLIELYEQQIQDLVMMSKIELGDDVIAKIKELKSQINKQQTAVEWLINAVEANMGDIPLEVQEQAKEMEKEQIMDAIIISEKEHIIQGNVYPPQFVVDKAKQYYKKTYGGNK